ncbi:hypothetical protein A4R27_12140 [Priestia endophytica]|nr:hypothetical protein A4R27_12140 [Priestia endophytica]
MVTFLIIKKEQLVAALFFLNDWIVLHITCITIVWKSWSMFYGFKRIRVIVFFLAGSPSI